jgi:hypothetical protein
MVERFCRVRMQSTRSMTVTCGCRCIKSSRLRSQSAMQSRHAVGQPERVCSQQRCRARSRTRIRPQLVDDSIKWPLLLQWALHVHQRELQALRQRKALHFRRQVPRDLRGKQWFSCNTYVGNCCLQAPAEVHGPPSTIPIFHVRPYVPPTRQRQVTFTDAPICSLQHAQGAAFTFLGSRAHPTRMTLRSSSSLPGAGMGAAFGSRHTVSKRCVCPGDIRL